MEILLATVFILGPFLLAGWILSGTLDSDSLVVGVVIAVPFLALVATVTGVGLLDEGGAIVYGAALLALRVVIEIWHRTRRKTSSVDVPKNAKGQSKQTDKNNQVMTLETGDSDDLSAVEPNEPLVIRHSYPHTIPFDGGPLEVKVGERLAQSDNEPRQAQPKGSKTVKAQVKISKKLARKLEEDMTCVACNCVFKGAESFDITPETLRCPSCNQLLVIY